VTITSRSRGTTVTAMTTMATMIAIPATVTILRMTPTTMVHLVARLIAGATRAVSPGVSLLSHHGSKR